jgi:HEAT repeat protein
MPARKMRFMGCAALLLCGALRLAAQPNVSSWDVLKRDLADHDPETRQQAVLAMASIGPAPEVIELLDESLRDKEPLVRQATAAAIGQQKIRRCIPNLRAALDDTSPVAFTAARALWDMGDYSGRDLFEQVYTGQRKDSPSFIHDAIRDAKHKIHHPRELAMIGVNEASGALLGPFSMGIIVAEDMMKDSGAPTRALAITMLAQRCDARGQQLMEWALNTDKNNLVRAATAKALGKCGDAKTVERLTPLLADNSTAVRDMAAAAIVRLSIQKGTATKTQNGL